MSLNSILVTGLVVLKDGALVHESYHLGTGAEDLRISWSVAKSVLSALYGILLAEGAVGSPDDPVTRHVPELAGSAYDGATVRDVLTCGAAIFRDDWPEIAVLPKGKTNALTVDLGVPRDWTVQNALDAYHAGRRVHRRPIEITTKGERSRVLGFILGAGAFTTATRAGQGTHRLGAFNSMAVVVTVNWGIVQFLFSSRANSWRCRRCQVSAARPPARSWRWPAISAMPFSMAM